MRGQCGMKANSAWNLQRGNVPEMWIRMGSVLLVETADIQNLQEMRSSLLFSFKVWNGAGNLFGKLGKKGTERKEVIIHEIL